MARYIECEVACAEIDKGDLLVGNNAEFAKEIINRTPTADVVPKSEVERLTVELDAMRGAANSYKMHYENAKAEVARLETENLILKQKRLNLFDRLEFVKMARAKGAIEVIEHLENEGLLNMTPQGIANFKKKYTEGEG